MENVEVSEESWKVVELEDRDTPYLLHTIITWLLS